MLHVLVFRAGRGIAKSLREKDEFARGSAEFGEVLVKCSMRFASEPVFH